MRLDFRKLIPLIIVSIGLLPIEFAGVTRYRDATLKQFCTDAKLRTQIYVLHTSAFGVSNRSNSLDSETQ